MVAKLKVDQLETVDGTGIITANNPLAGDGASLTGLNATNLGSGTVPTARLGTGTADADNFLRGDGAWEPAGGGKVLQVVSEACPTDDNGTTSSTMAASKMEVTITTSKVNSKLLVTMTPFIRWLNDATQSARFAIRSSVDSYASDLVSHDQFITQGSGWTSSNGGAFQLLHNPQQPANTAITYKLYWRKSGGGSQYILINSTDYWNYGGTLTESTIMEIEA